MKINESINGMKCELCSQLGTQTEANEAALARF